MVESPWLVDVGGGCVSKRVCKVENSTKTSKSLGKVNQFFLVWIDGY